MKKFMKISEFSIHFISRFIRKPVNVTSLDHLRNSPQLSSGDTRNAYIPSNRRTIYRELLQDSSIILPSERFKFEEFALSLKTKIGAEFQLLQNEILTGPISSDPHSPSVRTLSSAERLDNEFWTLQRLSQLAAKAGFFDLTRDQLEHACQPKVFRYNKSVLSYVQPADYEVLRFWIRGVHPYGMTSTMGSNAVTDSPTSSPFFNRATAWLSSPIKHLQKTANSVCQSTVSRLFRIGSSSWNKAVCVLDELCFTHVMMAVQQKGDKCLRIKIFNYVPASKSSGGSLPTDNLSYLLPRIRYLPLTTGGRILLLSSALTAVGCIGLVAPLAWLLTTNPDLVIAWSTATTAGTLATASLVWARYWRGQAQLEDWIKRAHYQCGSLSGVYAIDNLLCMAREEEYKSALLAYALLLRPTEAGCPLTPIQLGLRAESWLAKRLRPRPHISLSSTNLSSGSFTGGSGPLFDLYFDPQPPLQLLRRLDLIRGPESHPQAVPIDQVATCLRSTVDHLAGKTNSASLWILDSSTDH